MLSLSYSLHWFHCSPNSHVCKYAYICMGVCLCAFSYGLITFAKRRVGVEIREGPCPAKWLSSSSAAGWLNIKMGEGRRWEGVHWIHLGVRFVIINTHPNTNTHIYNLQKKHIRMCEHKCKNTSYQGRDACCHLLVILFYYIFLLNYCLIYACELYLWNFVHREHTHTLTRYYSHTHIYIYETAGYRCRRSRRHRRLPFNGA